MLSKLLRYPGLLLWVFIAYATAIWLYSVPFTGDEKVYLSTALEMRNHGDWLHPWLLGEHAYYKPPLQYWATLLGWRILGFGTAGAFLPSALATVLTAGCVGWISRRVLGLEDEQVTAPLWFAACAGTLTYGTTAQMEIWVVALYSLAWAAAIEHRRTGRWELLFAALAAAGLLSIVKSPLYSVLWVLGYWLFLALTDRWPGLSKYLSQPMFWLAHAFGVALGVFWYVYVLATDGKKFWADYVVRETLSKAGGNSSTVGHMWADFCTFCVPFLLMATLCAALCMRRRHRSLLPLVIGWAALPAVFFSVFPYRTETYLYILIPLLAVILDLRPSLSDLELGWLRASSRLNGTVTAIAGGAFSWVALASGMIPLWIALPLFVFSASFGALSWSELSNDRWKSLALTGLAIMLVIRLGAISLGEQDIADLRQTLRELPGRELTFLDKGGNIWHEAGLLSTATAQPGKRALDVPQFESALREGAIGVLSDGDWATAMPELRAHLSASGLLLHEKNWWRWKRSFQVPTPSDLLEMAGKDAPGWRERNQREYKLVWIPSR